VKFEDQSLYQMDVKRFESIREFCERHKFTFYATKQNGVKLNDHKLNYQLATPDNLTFLNLTTVWVKVDDGKPLKPIQLIAKGLKNFS